jgi:hypothetical protein
MRRTSAGAPLPKEDWDQDSNRHPQQSREAPERQVAAVIHDEKGETAEQLLRHWAEDNDHSGDRPHTNQQENDGENRGETRVARPREWTLDDANGYCWHRASVGVRRVLDEGRMKPGHSDRQRARRGLPLLRLGRGRRLRRRLFEYGLRTLWWLYRGGRDRCRVRRGRLAVSAAAGKGKRQDRNPESPSDLHRNLTPHRSTRGSITPLQT